MRELKVDDFRDVRALARVLTSLDAEPSYREPSMPLPSGITHIMRRNPFRVLFHAPPISTALEDFITTNIAFEILTAFDAFARLVSLSTTRDGRSHIWGRDLVLWTHICRWTDYMCILSDPTSIALQPEPGRRTTDLLKHALEIVINVLHCIGLISPELSPSIVFASDCKTIRTAVNMFLYWPRVYGVEPTDPDIADRAIVCASTLSLILHGRIPDTAVDIIIRAVDHHPRRLYRMSATLIRMGLRQNEDAHRMHLNLKTTMIHLARMAASPALRARRYPRCLVSVLVACLQRYKDAAIPAKGDSNFEDDPCFVAYNTLADICMRDSNATLRALQQGVFPILASIGINHPERDINRLLRYIRDSLLNRQVIQAFHDTFASDLDSALLPEKLSHIVSLASSRYTTKTAAEAHFKNLAQCCNVACPDRGGGRIRACACAEALYCSKSCQAYHWREGGHRVECPGRDEGDGLLSPRDVVFFRALVQESVENNFAELIRDDRSGRVTAGSENLHFEFVVTPPALRDGQRSMGLEDGTQSVDPSITVRVYFLDNGWSRVRDFVFRPELGKPSSEPDKFRLLTHGYLESWDASSEGDNQFTIFRLLARGQRLV
ncbi:hypothetical protein BD626DRAFT_629565 [Schizophyllum amplum]|uniref:MYND-type domain-containing protein n=1 Tax=Schizophyllum amplum TaxID=97359 RepID=A0A550CG34_9AGAR|nr:hypothetical protein BD626DRAFT_629565 [Auriculariopsis ampla]